jgi:hypothetical protein
MYVIINLNHDGDSYFLTENLDKAQAEFNECCKEEEYNFKVILCRPTLEGTFGFGSRGELYGAEIIEEWWRED